MPYKKYFFLLFSFIIFLTACNTGNIEEDIHLHLEESVAIEKELEEQQKKITNLEEQEQNIYNQIVDLGMDEFDKIIEMTEEAFDIIDKRFDAVLAEKATLEDSQEEFIKIKDLIEELNEETEEVAHKMYETMIERYDAYDDLHEAYIKSLELEEELYTLLGKEDTEQDDVTEQITKINDSYQIVLDENETFNSITQTYNSLKKDFYESADINVVYEKD